MNKELIHTEFKSVSVSVLKKNYLRGQAACKTPIFANEKAPVSTPCRVSLDWVSPENPPLLSGALHKSVAATLAN